MRRSLQGHSHQTRSDRRLAGSTEYWPTSTEYWVSGPRKDGQDTLYPGVVEIDEDVRVEYWRDVRGEPARIAETSYRSRGVHGNHATR